VKILGLHYHPICHRYTFNVEYVAWCCNFVLLYLMCFVFVTYSLVFDACAGEEERDPVYDFLTGSYEVIGRWPDSNKTYTGRVDIIHKNGLLVVTRNAGGKKIKCDGKIERSGADNIKVLRIKFNHYGNDYNGTYIINSDLDNYGRLTGYLYLANGTTRKVGLEALFSDHGQLARE